MKSLHPNNLKQFRKEVGLSQEEVTILIGLHSSNRLSRWEAGKTYPSISNALKLAKVYGVQVEELFRDYTKK